MAEKIVCLEADHYRDEIEILKSDPIILAMRASLPADFDYESSGFMSAALHEYNRRGGTNAKSIGGPVRALRALAGGA